MKFTYMGFSQKVAVDMGLDLIDLAILRYFIDFKDSGSMLIEIIENEKYYWVKYEGIISANPIFNIKSKDAVARRMKNMTDKEILKRYIKKEKGTFTFYTVGENYKRLIDDRPHDLKVECKESKESTVVDNSIIENKEVTDDFKTECTGIKQSTGLDSKLCTTPDFKVDRGSVLKSNRFGSKVDTKDSSIKDSSIKKIDDDIENIELILFTWNKVFKSNINQITKNDEVKINNIISLYGISEVIKTIQRAIKSKYLLGEVDGKKADISWFFVEDNFIKVMNGAYDDRIVKEKKQQKNRFHNFTGRSSEYTEEDLERIARNKREEYFAKIDKRKLETVMV